MFTKLFFVLILTFGSAITKDISSYFQICKRDNTVNECLRAAIQDAFVKLSNGLSDFKISSIDPLKVPTVSIGAGTGPVQVVQNYNDVRIINIGTSKTEDAKVELTDKNFKLEFTALSEDLIFQANYDFNGKILVLPIVGKGKCTFHLYNLRSYITVIGEAEVRDGITYMPIKEATIKLVPEKVAFNFENLFNGDERLGAEMNRVLNENEKDVFNDIKSGYEEFLGIIIKDIANHIFGNVPYLELIPK